MVDRGSAEVVVAGGCGDDHGVGFVEVFGAAGMALLGSSSVCIKTAMVSGAGRIPTRRCRRSVRPRCTEPSRSAS